MVQKEGRRSACYLPWPLGFILLIGPSEYHVHLASALLSWRSIAGPAQLTRLKKIEKHVLSEKTLTRG